MSCFHFFPKSLEWFLRKSLFFLERLTRSDLIVTSFVLFSSTIKILLFVIFSRQYEFLIHVYSSHLFTALFSYRLILILSLFTVKTDVWSSFVRGIIREQFSDVFLDMNFFLFFCFFFRFLEDFLIFVLFEKKTLCPIFLGENIVEQKKICQVNSKFNF